MLANLLRSQAPSRHAATAVFSLQQQQIYPLLSVNLLQNISCRGFSTIIGSAAAGGNGGGMISDAVLSVVISSQGFCRNKSDLFEKIIAFSADDNAIAVDSALIPAAAAVSNVDPAISDLGLGPVALIERALCTVHDVTGLPWYGAIILTTMTLRFAMLPIVIKTLRNVHRMKLAKPELDRVKKLMEDKPPLSEEERMQYANMMKNVYSQYQVNPLATLAPVLIQIPVFVCFFFALQDLSNTFPSFKEGGALWFTDLTVADATWAMPVISSAGFLLTMELGGEVGEQSGQTKQMRNIFRFAGVAMIPLTLGIQQSVFVYWICSNAFSATQTGLFKIPAVQEYLQLKPSIPGLTTSSSSPPASPFSGSGPVQFIPIQVTNSDETSNNDGHTSIVNRRRHREMGLSKTAIKGKSKQ